MSENRRHIINKTYTIKVTGQNLTGYECEIILDEIDRKIKQIKSDIEYDYYVNVDIKAEK